MEIRGGGQLLRSKVEFKGGGQRWRWWSVVEIRGGGQMWRSEVEHIKKFELLFISSPDSLRLLF